MAYLSKVLIPVSECYEADDPYQVHQYLFRKYFSGNMSREFLFKVKSFDRVYGLTVLVLSTTFPESKIGIEVKEFDPKNMLKTGQILKFHVIVNTSKRVDGKDQCRNEDESKYWFTEKGKSCGYEICGNSLEISGQKKVILYKGYKGDTRITLAKGVIKGILKITDIEKFSEMVIKGVGKKGAFGFGLMELSRA